MGSAAGAHMARLNARERRRSLAGMPELFRTHRFAGSAMGVASISTPSSFASRAGPITFRTAIRITENAGVHRGLVFEFGGTTNGIALWIGDETIGFHSGPAGLNDGATATFENGAELPVGLELDLVCAAHPGKGQVRIWGNGRELARYQTKSGGPFNPMVWSGSNDGSFASAAQGTLVSDVPAESVGAPAGFEVIAPLSVYQKQVPRHFV